MPFNVLLLPLLGGYIFISHWNPTRFHTRRYSGERLLFHASTAGIGFLILAFVITRGIRLTHPPVYTWWRSIVPFEYTGTSFLAFLLGATGWWPLNVFTNREAIAKKAIEEWGDFLEILLNKCMDETKQIAVTLKSGKVYVGFVISSFDPSFERKYILLLPTSSGYRTDESKSLIFTHDYTLVYEEMFDDEDDEGIDDFQLVIPVAEIVSANLFDPAVYERFAGLPDNPGTTTP